MQLSRIHSAIFLSVIEIPVAAVPATAANHGNDIARPRPGIQDASAITTSGVLYVKRRYRNGNYTGRTYSAYYGLVQVAAKIQNGELYYVDVLKHPSDRRTSRIINRRALPRLEREVITAQSAHVDTVSGATLTSRAFLRSLGSALAKARTRG